MATLEDIKELKHQELTTLSAKVIYLTIEDNVNEEGWASISLTELSKATSMTRRGVIKALQRLLASGLIEKRSNPNAINHYRTIK